MAQRLDVEAQLLVLKLRSKNEETNIFIKINVFAIHKEWVPYKIKAMEVGNH
jgi:hypothetical protein